MCIRESHQDATTFHDPTTFDPDRFIGRSFTRAEYAPFGAFRLACIGEELTKTVGAIKRGVMRVDGSPYLLH